MKSTEKSAAPKAKKNKFTRHFLRKQFGMYLETAVDLVMEAQEKDNLPSQGLYPKMMMKAIEEFTAPEGMVLGWVCEDCGETDCNCK